MGSIFSASMIPSGICGVMSSSISLARSSRVFTPSARHMRSIDPYTFANGCIANLTASRISRDRVRKIRFFQPKAYVSIDYAAQKLEVFRLVKGNGPVPAIEGGDVPVENEEPLKRELADFVEAIRTRRPPTVTGEDGRRALALAQQIADKMTDAATKTRKHEKL